MTDDLVTRAAERARELYGDRRRKDGTLVAEHAEAVALLAAQFGDGALEVLAAALLHDVVEAGAASVEDLRAEFGEEVARLVDAMTVRPGEDAAAAAARAAAEGADALLLRLCDRLDGMRRATERPAGQREKFLREAESVHLPLAEKYYPVLAMALLGAIESARADEPLGHE
jgi:GTP pyrophosphokinase